MSYSDTQFQRALLKTLDKIADELHKSNKITEKAFKYNEKAIELTKDSNELDKLITAVNIGLISKDEFFSYLSERLRNLNCYSKENINEETDSTSEDLE